MQVLHDFVEPNGKTIKENNLEKSHGIPVGTLVEVKFDSWFGDGACWKVHARLWVVRHDRDCDGTPLYSLSRWSNPAFAFQVSDVHCGFDEDALTPIELTQEVTRGDDVIQWD